MRSKELLLAVKKHIEENLQEFSETDLQVFIHNLPVQEVSEDNSLFPFVILRLDEKKLEENYTEDTLIFALGINENADQEKAGLLLAKLHDALFALFYTKRIAGAFFETLLPITAKQIEPERKWHDFHYSSMEITFKYNTLPPRPLGAGFEHEEDIIVRGN